MYQRIMVPLDGSAFGERALPMAVSLARKTGGWLQLACCAEGGEPRAGGAASGQTQEVAEAKAYLRSVADWIARQGIGVTTAVPTKPEVEGLIGEAQRTPADLIVMGTHGRSGMGRWIYGSVAEGVVKCADCPVILVRPTGPLASLDPEPAGLIVPLDGSRFAEAALPHALELALLFKATITLAQAVVSPALTAPGVYMYDFAAPDPIQEGHAQDVREAERYLTTVADELRRDGVEVRTVVGESWPLDVIVREALSGDARLVVMATHAKLGVFNWIMGRTTMEVLHRSLLPVMLIRPDREAAAALGA